MVDSAYRPPRHSSGYPQRAWLPNGPSRGRPSGPAANQNRARFPGRGGIANPTSNHFVHPYPVPPRPPAPPQPISFISPPLKRTDESLMTTSGPRLPSSSSYPPPLAPRTFNNAFPSVQPVLHLPAIGPGGYPPLATPPLPPIFPYLSPELAKSLHEGATNCGLSFANEAGNLPFVPVIVSEADLQTMMESVKTQAKLEKANLLLYEDIIDQSLPNELKSMFQPLYCKLCTLTLSSPVVARDHYKGKRHHLAIEEWMKNHPKFATRRQSNNNRLQQPLHNYNNIISGTVQLSEANSTPLPLFSTPLPVSGSRGGDRVNGFNFNNDQGLSGRPVRPPYPSRNDGNDVPFNRSNFNSLRGGGRGRGIKRGPDFMGQHHQNDSEFIPAYRAQLAPPGGARKRPRREEGGGGMTMAGGGGGVGVPRHFGSCDLCNVHHTSKITADQHYSGKQHKAAAARAAEGQV